MNELTLKAIGDPSRYRLLTLMAERGYCVRALARKSGLSEPAVSQHLKLLRDAGLITGEKLGYYTHYRINKEALSDVISEFSALRDTERLPCDGPYYGCRESEYVHCKAYVPHMTTTEKKE